MEDPSRFLIPTQAGFAVRGVIAIELLAFSPDASDTGGLVFLIAFTACSCVPYVVTYFLTATSPTRGDVAAVTALTADTLAAAVLTSVFWTRQLWNGQIVAFTPFVNLLVLIPIAYLATSIVQKVFTRGRDAGETARAGETETPSKRQPWMSGF